VRYAAKRVTFSGLAGLRNSDSRQHFFRDSVGAPSARPITAVSQKGFEPVASLDSTPCLIQWVILALFGHANRHWIQCKNHVSVCQPPTALKTSCGFAFQSVSTCLILHCSLAWVRGHRYQQLESPFPSRLLQRESVRLALQRRLQREVLTDECEALTQ
jgi:hypothetical protein